MKIPFIPDPEGGFYDIGFGKLLDALSDYAKSQNAPIVAICAAIEAEIADLDDAAQLEVPGLSFTPEEAIAIIQRAERGRQGKMRAAMFKERRDRLKEALAS